MGITQYSGDKRKMAKRMVWYNSKDTFRDQKNSGTMCVTETVQQTNERTCWSSICGYKRCEHIEIKKRRILKRVITYNTRRKCNVCKQNSKLGISGFRRNGDEICALLGYYTTPNANTFPTFRDNVSLPSSRARTLQDGKYTLSRNVGNWLPLNAA
jgi:hypothetical protein